MFSLIMVRSFVQDLIMLLCKVFVIEFVSVDGLAPSAIASREVSSLGRDHFINLWARDFYDPRILNH